MLPPLSVVSDTSNHLSIHNFFDRIYVINLPYRRDRYRAMTRQLQRLGLQFHPGKFDRVPGLRGLAQAARQGKNWLRSQ